MKIKVEDLDSWAELIIKLIRVGVDAAQAGAKAEGKGELTIEELEGFIIKPNEERRARWRRKAGLEE